MIIFADTGIFLYLYSMIQSKLGEFYTDIFKDKRIDKRANLFLSSLITNGSAIVNQSCIMHPEKIGSYRLLNNPKCGEKELSKALYDSCSANIQGPHLLCIQDTTEIDYSSHKKRIKDLDSNIGRLTNTTFGYLCHPMLVIDADRNMPIGFSSVKLWNREWEKPVKAPKGYKKLPIEKKESFRWISSVTESRKNLPKDSIVTIIADRESDVYEALCTIPNENTHLLIRSSSNRLTCENNMLLLDKMQSCEIQHTYKIELKGNKSRKSRTALIDLRYTTVDVKRTAQTIGNYPSSVKMNCIYVVECSDTVPEGEDPIEWRLYTTHPIDTIEQAMECVEWYRARWYIEELFRVLKSDGLDIESSQLETGLALKRLILFSLQAALQIMIIKTAYDQKREDCSDKLMFTDQQIEFIGILKPTLEGKTVKQKNPFLDNSLASAAWVIARLGKWGGYNSQGPPGYITMKKGLDVFHIQFNAFLITYQAMKDVYKE
jgi:Transposase DDE domain